MMKNLSSLKLLNWVFNISGADQIMKIMEEIYYVYSTEKEGGNPDEGVVRED